MSKGRGITELSQSETELKRTKKSLEKTMDLAKIGGWEIDFTKETIHWIGLTRDMAEVSIDYMPDLKTSVKFYKEGESRDKAQEALKKAMKEGKSFEIEIQMVSIKGTEYWVRMRGESKMVNGKCEKIYGYFQNITDQVALKDKNQQLEKRFLHMFEKSTDAIVLQEGNGKILYCSPSIEDIIGYTPEEVKHRKSATLFHPDDMDYVNESRKRIIAAQGKSFPIVIDRIQHKKGHYVQVEGTVTNLLHDENVQAIVSYFRDVTEKKLIEENLKSKNNQLEKIAWLFSHEVRGPVATIMGLTNIFDQEEISNPLNGEIIEKISIPIHQLDEIISQIVKRTSKLELEKGEALLDLEEVKTASN